VNKLAILIVVVVGTLLLGKNTIFVLDEGRQAIITEFGKPVGKPVTNAGIHFKKPFVQDVRYVDKRMLSWDGYPNQIPTKDKKFIKVDTTARYRIVDALKFIQSVRNTRGAKARLDTILDSATRNVISGHTLVEAVRNSNGILDRAKARKEELKKKKADEIDEEVTGEIKVIHVGRDKLSQLIAQKADGELAEFGIKLIDVQLRRISYEQSVEKKVYERMISERRRIAQKIRSIGAGEKAKIEGRLEKDPRKIRSEAYKKSQVIRGVAEAKASAIYAKSYSKGPKFYEFMKSMDSYKKSIKKEAKLILSNDSEFLKYLK
jgi:modulator of FtsH protease HflC